MSKPSGNTAFRPIRHDHLLQEAVRHAYQGEPEFHRNPQECLPRVNWQR